MHDSNEICIVNSCITPSPLCTPLLNWRIGPKSVGLRKEGTVAAVDVHLHARYRGLRSAHRYEESLKFCPISISACLRFWTQYIVHSVGVSPGFTSASYFLCFIYISWFLTSKLLNFQFLDLYSFFIPQFVLISWADIEDSTRTFAPYKFVIL